MRVLLVHNGVAPSVDQRNVIGKLATEVTEMAVGPRVEELLQEYLSNGQPFPHDRLIVLEGVPVKRLFSSVTRLGASVQRLRGTTLEAADDLVHTQPVDRIPPTRSEKRGYRHLTRPTGSDSRHQPARIGGRH